MLPRLRCRGKTVPYRLRCMRKSRGWALAAQLPEVIALTRELFGEFTIDISDDPEIFNCSYVTFSVRAKDPSDKAFQRESEWIRRLPRCPTQAPGSFCINVN